MEKIWSIRGKNPARFTTPDPRQYSAVEEALVRASSASPKGRGDGMHRTHQEKNGGWISFMAGPQPGPVLSRIVCSTTMVLYLTLSWPGPALDLDPKAGDAYCQAFDLNLLGVKRKPTPDPALCLTGQNMLGWLSNPQPILAKICLEWLGTPQTIMDPGRLGVACS